jgi:hypothetical protein
MSARTILKRRAEEMGWSTESQLTLCLRYISNQKSDDAFADFLDQAAATEKGMEGTLVEGALSVPACWSDLIGMAFPGDLEGVADAKHHRDGVDDPDPYYDDVRRVSAKLPHDYVAEMELASGQGNYWATVQVIDNSNGEIVFQTEPYHEEMEEVRRVVDGTEFVVDIFFDR